MRPQGSSWRGRLREGYKKKACKGKGGGEVYIKKEAAKTGGEEETRPEKRRGKRETEGEEKKKRGVP